MAATLASCVKFPEPEDDDEGHATFAREVIPLLLGRRPYGVDEVEAVADIAQLYGRPTVIEMLMKDEAFVDHWSDVLVDLLRIQRERTGGIGVAQDSSCWGEPTRNAPDPSIAEWVRDHSPGDAGAPADWNMTDLLQSAIELDDLSPLYRANLFTMSMRRAGSNGRRPQITQHFLHTYLNRDIACLRCHNPSYSTSNKTNDDGDIVWRRTWTIPGHPEKALFGDYLDAIAATSRIEYIMRGDVRQPADDGMGIRPWGMADACVIDTSTQLPANDGTQTHAGFRALGAGTSNFPAAGFGSLDGSANPKVSLWELEQSLRDGVIDLQDGYQRLSGSSPILPPDEQLFCDVVQIFSSNCTGCHSGGAASANMDLSANDLSGVLINTDTEAGDSTLAKRVVPGNTAQSELFRRVTAGAYPPRMPPGGPLSGDNIDTIEDWITQGAMVIDSSNCNTSSIPDVAPDEAFAFLTAANLVDGIWMAAMGYRLTIDNGFPRNKQQRDALWRLTEYTFLPNDWSLKSVLRQVLASNWMGRRAPTISQADTAYELPIILDPWVQADPTEVANPAPHEKANGQGEMVNRYRVNTVLRNIAHALAWEQPRRFPGAGYPSPLDQNLGQFLSPGQPGFNGINFQSLLALEDEAGLCQKTGHAVASQDWIDVLVDEIVAFNSASPGAPLTIGEAWSILKDRMIQDPTIEQTLPVELAPDADSQTEAQALVALMNQGLGTSLTLNSPATDLNSADLNTKLREACGVLVKTPEFLLTNITPRGYSENNMPDPPRMNVCMDGEPCGYPASCAKWRSVLNSMGKYTACEDRSVRESKWLVVFPLPSDLVFELVNNRFDNLCPSSICGFVEAPRLNPCLLNPERCEEVDAVPPVPVDPEFTTLLGRAPVDLHKPGMLVMKADGAQVVRAEGVRYRGVDAQGQGWQTLDSGSTLRTGDQLYVPLTAMLHIKTGELEFGVDPLDRKEVEGVRAQFISITGDDAVSVIDRRFTKPGTLSVSALNKAVQSGTIETRAPTEQDWQRIIGYGARPGSLYTPTVDEIERMNADFDAQHAGLDDHTFPDDEPVDDKLPNEEPPKDQSDEIEPPAGDNRLWWILVILVILALIGLAVVRTRR
ncbi:MAG: hypothetical protein WD397_07800 [Wenzhouxiangellaceae bacterium]